MDHPDLTVSYFMEKSIGLPRVKQDIEAKEKANL